MNKIVAKTRLSDEVFRVEIEAPYIAHERKAGQFVIVQTDVEWGERVPLTIADADPRRGTITLIFQTVGVSTHRLAELEPGDSIEAVLGPLGNPTHIERFGHTVCIGGGIGVAPMYPIAQALKKAGNHLTVIMGARTKDLIILEDEMRAIADELIVVTDDGSWGRKALVTEPLKELCQAERKPELAVAIGPPIMMKFCAETTRPFGVKTLASLNTIMIDGTGMCGGCRVSVGGITKFVCVDGPEFDAHLVDWDGMMLRLRAYKPLEDAAHKALHEGGECRLVSMAEAAKAAAAIDGGSR